MRLQGLHHPIVGPKRTLRATRTRSCVVRKGQYQGTLNEFVAVGLHPARPAIGHRVRISAGRRQAYSSVAERRPLPGGGRGFDSFCAYQPPDCTPDLQPLAFGRSINGSSAARGAAPQGPRSRSGQRGRLARRIEGSAGRVAHGRRRPRGSGVLEWYGACTAPLVVVPGGGVLPMRLTRSGLRVWPESRG